jgi:hypothetical protein
MPSLLCPAHRSHRKRTRKSERNIVIIYRQNSSPISKLVHSTDCVKCFLSVAMRYSTSGKCWSNERVGRYVSHVEKLMSLHFFAKRTRISERQHAEKCPISIDKSITKLIPLQFPYIFMSTVISCAFAQCLRTVCITQRLLLFLFLEQSRSTFSYFPAFACWDNGLSITFELLFHDAVSLVEVSESTKSTANFEIPDY